MTATSDRHQPVVALDGLTKRYGSRTAVDRMTLEIPAGVVAGFIGPNGAGKTTTMAMLLGLVAPTAGGGTVLGQSLRDPSSYLGRVGALIEAPAFWPGLTGMENLRVIATLGGLDTRRIAGVLDVVGLADRGGDRFGEYSFGMKQRLGIGAALIGDPDLLVLDEPTNGLDPSGITEMRQLIGEIAHDDGRTVLVSSHILSELEQVCNWLIIIDQGSVVYQGPADGLLSEATPVIAVGPEHTTDLSRLERLVRADGLHVDPEGSVLIVSSGGKDPTALAASINAAAASAGIVLAELHVRRPSLESHYLAIVEGAEQ